MRQFASIEAIREADVETLKNVPSMNAKAAEAVYRFFRDQRREENAKTQLKNESN